MSHGDGGKWERLIKLGVVFKPSSKQSKDSWVPEGCTCNTDAPSNIDCNSQDIGLCLESVFLNSTERGVPGDRLGSFLVSTVVDNDSEKKTHKSFLL